MHYEWDPREDAENLRRHGLSLADGVAAFEDPNAESWIDDRYDYNEVRVITPGVGAEGIRFVVTTEIADDLTRIISVRKADANEKNWYYQGRSPSR